MLTIIRHALGGRNWEGFSPDPYLTGIASAMTVEAIQSVGVQGCIKHYIGNEQETHRSNTRTPNGTNVAAMVSNIDDRTMHELYLWPFADTIKSGVASVMCSYNRINQTYACENSKSLNGLLKDELAFQGYVVSDWQATHSSAESVLAGLDMDMPGYLGSSVNGSEAPSYFGLNLTALVNNGTIPESRLDDMIRRVMTPYFYLNQDQNYPTVDPTTGPVSDARSNSYQLPVLPARDVRANHAGLIRLIATAGTVLLKNTNNTLPLQNPANIAVFGSSAPDVTNGLAITANSSIGTLILGGGSGTARATYIVSPLNALLLRASQTGSRVQYVTDNQEIASGNLGGLYPLPDVCLVFLKTYAGEGQDRSLYELDGNSTAAMSQITNVCNNTVVVTHSVGINTMPWADNPNVTAILAAHLPGQESGNSIMDVLFGDVNPSGKLPYTIARNSSDYNAPILNLTGTSQEYDADAWQSDFSEGLLIDYRHFDAKNITPQFEFGFGLSYTTFSLSGLSIPNVTSGSISATPPPAQNAPGGNPTLWQIILSPSVTVTNTGDRAGATVVQLYLSFPQDSVPSGTPVRVLRGFEKVYLEANASSTVTMQLRRRDLSYWDVGTQEWVVPAGEIRMSAGFSSRDLQVNGTVTLLS